MAKFNKIGSIVASDEEFGNFCARVNEVTNIVKNLTTDDKQTNQAALAQAEIYLNGTPRQTNDLNVVYNKTLISKTTASVSQDAFMKSVEIDAQNRYRDRLQRKERAETLKKRGNKAFRANELEKALVLYTDALDLVKDSAVLYTNRALTHVHLEMFDAAIADCQAALKLNERSLKALLYLGKCFYYLGRREEFDDVIAQVKGCHGDMIGYIDEYVEDMKETHRLTTSSEV